MANINYVAAATSIDPDVMFLSLDSVYNYENLAWSGTPISKSTLEAAWVATEKQKQIKEITDDMNIEVTSGFLSDALVVDEFRKYDSNLQEQIAVIGAMVYLTPHEGLTPPSLFTLSSVDPATGMRGYHEYDPAQLYHLLGDIGTFSAELITKLTTKITAIMMINTGNANTDLDQIYAITWQSVE